MDVVVSLPTITPEERTRLVRSARKLEQVLGSSAFFAEFAAPHQPFHTHPATTRRRRPNHGRTRTEFGMDTTQPGFAPTLRGRPARSMSRRQGSIFDLSAEEEVRALGTGAPSHDSPIPSPIDVPRSSTDSASSISSVLSDSHSLFDRPHASSASSSRTSLDAEMECPLPAIQAAPTAAVTRDNAKTSKSRRGSIPPLFLAAAASSSAIDGGLRPELPIPSRMFLSVPPTPATPTPDELTHRQHTPSELTGGDILKASPRPAQLMFDRSATTKPSQAQRRPRTSSAVCKQFAFQNATLDDSAPSPDACSHAAAPFEPSFPVFASGPRQPEADHWVGVWNRPDIYTVQAELRALRWR